MVEGGVLNEGAVARRLHVPPRWPSAEELVVARDVMLAEVTGAAVHIQHLSTAHAVEFVASARKRGARVTAEATPHHLTLTEEDAACGDPVFKMNPPLRTDGDMQALRRALADGTITCVATDHAPHTAAAKARGLRDAPAGVIGMETALAVVWTRLVEPGLLTPLQAADRMSLGPARAFGLPGGSIAPGSPADVVLFDPREAWTVDPARFLSRSRNCPFAGQLLRGRVAATIVAGEVRHRSA
jgi:dihydroorotase